MRGAPGRAGVVAETHPQPAASAFVEKWVAATRVRPAALPGDQQQSATAEFDHVGVAEAPAAAFGSFDLLRAIPGRAAVAAGAQGHAAAAVTEALAVVVGEQEVAVRELARLRAGRAGVVRSGDDVVARAVPLHPGLVGGHARRRKG